ncbi:hypothetical protein [Halovenus halobia]|uniref:hypothetical protein n=1 Tax=Halovenus halobia TaxID=3396622 RepID=UPI003F54ED9B
MSRDARMVPVYLLAFVLVVVLLLANVTMAANRTALNADHTIETLGEENTYADVTAVVQDNTVDRVNKTIEEQKEQRREERIGNRDISDQQKEFIRQEIDDEFPDRSQQREFVTNALTERFVEGELTRNIRTVYAVLNGEQSDGQISVRIGRQQDQINQSIRDTLQDNSRIDQEQIIQLVARETPAQQNITENGTVPPQVKGASSTVSLLNTLNLVFPAVALVLLGGMFFFSGRDVRLTARFGGVTFAVAGVLGAAIGFFGGGIATGATRSALDADSAEFAAMRDGIVAVVDSMFGTIVTQGLILAVIGGIAVGVVFAEQRGYLDSDDQSRQGQRQQDQQQVQDSQYQQGRQQYDHQEQSGQPTSEGQYDQTQQDGSDQPVDQSQGDGQQPSDETTGPGSDETER